MKTSPSQQDTFLSLGKHSTIELSCTHLHVLRNNRFKVSYIIVAVALFTTFSKYNFAIDAFVYIYMVHLVVIMSSH